MLVMIMYLYLKNVAGVYNGMDRKEIELDFSDNDNKFNLICGNNGTGKSTISNSLDPYATECIRKDKKGEKRIIIKANKNNYDIRHFYEPTKTGHSVKSFITKIDKHGVRNELNSNGNVSSFKMMVEAELGVSEASMQLFKLGRDLSSLISKPPAQRKQFMTKFTEGADIYLILFKKISDDARLLKKILENTTDKLNDIGDIDNINKRLDESDETLEAISSKETELNNQLSVLKERCNIIMSEKDKQELISLSNDINDIQRKRDRFNISDDMLKMSKEQMFFRLQSLNDKSNNNNKIINMMKSNKDDIYSDLKAIQEEKYLHQEELDALDFNNDYDDIVEAIEIIKNKNIAMTETFRKSEKYKHLTISQIKNVIESFENISDDITFTVEDIDYDDLHSYKYEIDYDMMYRNISNNINSLNNELGSLNGSIASAQYLVELSETLKRRPLNCNNNNCPFILDAMSKTSDIAELDRTYKHIEKTKNKISEQENKLDNIWNLSKVSNKFKELFKLIASTDEILIRDAVETNDIILTNLYKNKFKFIDKSKLIKIIQILEIRDEFLENNNKIMYLQDIQLDSARYNELNSKINRLDEQESSMKKKLDIVANNIDANIISNNNNNNELSELNEIYSIKDKLDKLNSKIDRLNDLQGRMDTVNALYKQINVIDRYDLVKLRDMRVVCNKDRDKLMVKRIEAKKLKKYKKIIVEKYKDIEILYSALSTKEGIPLLFVSILLQETRNIANEILSEAFDDTIQLGKFKIDAKEFKIPVIGKGDDNDDASTASAGERALISLAMSLALSKQAGGGKYDSLSIDEVDGPLDSKRRRNFLRLLDEQTRKLNIKQVFIITHNNMFDDYSANLILLKDADVSKLKDKHIIFEY